jgi:hypothetical protein
MLEQYGRAIFDLSTAVEQLVTTLGISVQKSGHGTKLKAMADPAHLPVAMAAWGQSVPDGLHEYLPSTLDQIERIAEIIHDDNSTIGDLCESARDLQRRIQDELKHVYFYRTSKQQAQYYNTPQLFGEKVENRFPDAVDDIEGCGKCLAFGLGTAAVMHLMRVVEVGLKGLAASKPLDIPYAPSWESYLTQIQRKIAEKHDKKDLEWKKVEHFYRDVSGDLISVKQAWRNPSMHVARKYGVDEAQDIFTAVKRFMERLADGLP